MQCFNGEGEGTSKKEAVGIYKNIFLSVRFPGVFALGKCMKDHVSHIDEYDTI